MITFNKVRVSNFMSVGNTPVELELDSHKLTCISGENGSSKSTIITDTIYYALFGKSFRKANLPKIVNSITKKNMRVELDFTINNKKYKIIRGMKPAIFEIYINGVLKPPLANNNDYQKYLVNDILKIDELTFRQQVIVGSVSYNPFMQLNAADRRSVIENLIQLNIFGVMNEHAKQQYAEINNKINNTKHEISLLEVRISEQKKSDASRIEQYKTDIADYNNQIEQLLIEKNSLEEQFREAMGTIDKTAVQLIENEQRNIEASINKAKDIKMQVSGEINLNNKHLKFFKENDTCPTCTQYINDKLKSDKIGFFTTKNANLGETMNKIDVKMEELQNRYRDKQTEKQSIQDVINNANSFMTRASMVGNNINILNRNIDIKKRKIEEESNVVSDDIQKYLDEMTVLTAQMDEYQEEKLAMEEILKQLKDNGIKATILKTYMPVLNQLIAKYIDAIGFDMIFELDETFNETFKSINKEEFSYNNLSEGEKLRIDVCILFAFRELAKMQSSVTTNLLILDEYEKGVLDKSAIDAIGTLLSEMKEENIFVITHMTDYYSAIADRNLFCKKINGFSTVSQS